MGGFLEKIAIEERPHERKRVSHTRFTSLRRNQLPRGRRESSQRGRASKGKNVFWVFELQSVNRERSSIVPYVAPWLNDVVL